MFWGLPSRVPKERRSQEVISAQHCYSLLLATDHPPHHSKYNSSHESELDCQKCRKRYSGEWGGCRRTKASHTALNELSVADKWGGCGGRGENILETENDNLYLAVEAVCSEPLSPNSLFNRENTGNSSIFGGQFPQFSPKLPAGKGFYGFAPIIEQRITGNYQGNKS